MDVLVCDPCVHTMVTRCPGCRREVWGPGVWVFSHGQGACGCGYTVTPRERTLSGDVADGLHDQPHP